VRETALDLFTRVGFHGFGYLEMKQDAHTGQHFIMEANVGRPTVRSPIAEAGGVALHYAAYCDAIGAPLPPNLTQTYGGAKWAHLHYDLRSAWHDWRRGALTLADWRRSWQGIKGHALWSRVDPAPFWYDLLTTAGRFIKNSGSAIMG
jgi:predicted ATP-grasp superfamily ATP-dependent carboligase